MAKQNAQLAAYKAGARAKKGNKKKKRNTSIGIGSTMATLAAVDEMGAGIITDNVKFLAAPVRHIRYRVFEPIWEKMNIPDGLPQGIATLVASKFTQKSLNKARLNPTLVSVGGITIKGF